MKILFICRHNRFRSKIAEAYFNKINKNSSLEARSAGIFPGRYPLDKLQVKIAKELGIELKGEPKAISTDLLSWKDAIIAITDDLPEGLFNYGPYTADVTEWKIPDELDGDEDNTREIIKKIMGKVEELIEDNSEKK